MIPAEYLITAPYKIELYIPDHRGRKGKGKGQKKRREKFGPLAK